jgi:hypothetical protein
MFLILSFDMGYASIGWSVIESSNQKLVEPTILGVGAVTFPTDDCLASQRRDLRRSRRHIRSTRQRIERLKRWFVHMGILDRVSLDRPGHAAPFLLAAAALQGHRTLDAGELWNVLRWYAHNRGYDGNSRWAKGEETTEDTEKVQAAHALMLQHGTHSMCETVTACMGLKPAEHAKTISSFLPYKTLNAAYPRTTVTDEVRKLLSLHLGKIPKFDAEAVRYILKEAELTASERAKLVEAGIQLPKRYFGGLLFGQLIPRFDNRIISRCPITWAKTYDEAIEAGEADTKARQLADKFAKVPASKCREFFRFRFAMLLANFKVDHGQPMSRVLRQCLWDLAEKQGRLTLKDINKIIKEAGHKPYNLDAYFKIHPDSEEALTLDPVIEFPHKNQIVKAIWSALTPEAQVEATARWEKGGSVSPQEFYQLSGESAAVSQAIGEIFDKDQAKAKAKRTYSTIQDLLDRKLSPATKSGRAPYARPVLRAVVEEVLSGPFHPLKACKATDPENGDDKTVNGVLYDLGIPGSRVRQLQKERPLSQLTNNHLVRHRMLILERLLDDIVVEFCTGGNEVGRVVVEVGRDLKEFSGMTAKEIATEMNGRLKDFKSAITHLEKFAPHLERNANTIRKCRIAMDMNWKCPFTGYQYEPSDLLKLEREHIIPYATRNTNSLHALVLTWPEVNRMKGKRTARQFIMDHPGQQIVGRENLSLFTLNHYDDFVKALDTKGHPDDGKRKRARKALLETTSFEDKELGFTEGMLTQSSHLMKLALRGLTQRFPAALCDPIPGPVTGEIRKAWRLMGTLALACPEIIDPTTDKLRPKDEIRGLTHLHHALDAATLGLAAHYFPLQSRGQDQKGKIWQALLKRNRSPEENDFLFRLGIFDRYERSRRDKDGQESRVIDVCLRDLPATLKEQLAHSLAQCRVMQHVPADQTGTKAELTTWSILCYEGAKTILLQRINRSTLKTVERHGTKQWESLPLNKKAEALLKKHADKLTSRQISLVRRGLLKLVDEPTLKLLGPNPIGETSKLQQHGKGQGALVVNDNFAIALDPIPTLIPFHKVREALDNLRISNGGNPVRLLRNGTLIRVSGGTWKGCWRITSVKNSEAYGISVDLATFHGTKMSKGNAKVPDMIREGLEILPRRYTGYSNPPGN